MFQHFWFPMLHPFPPSQEAVVLGNGLLNNVFLPLGPIAGNPREPGDGLELTDYGVLKSCKEKVMLIRGYVNSQWRKIDLKRGFEMNQSMFWKARREDPFLYAYVWASGAKTNNNGIIWQFVLNDFVMDASHQDQLFPKFPMSYKIISSSIRAWGLDFAKARTWPLEDGSLGIQDITDAPTDAPLGSLYLWADQRLAIYLCGWQLVLLPWDSNKLKPGVNRS